MGEPSANPGDRLKVEGGGGAPREADGMLAQLSAFTEKVAPKSLGAWYRNSKSPVAANKEPRIFDELNLVLGC
jgi:hypothetical protein